MVNGRLHGGQYSAKAREAWKLFEEDRVHCGADEVYVPETASPDGGGAGRMPKPRFTGRINGGANGGQQRDRVPLDVPSLRVRPRLILHGKPDDAHRTNGS